MRVSVFGSGYVGLVTGACLASVGNDVMCVDVDRQKIAALNKGEVPIYEPGLDDLIHNGLRDGRLQFSANGADAARYGEVQFIAVGTPPDEDGSADLQYVERVAQTIAYNLRSYAVVVTKSTVPVGTGDRVQAILETATKARQESCSFAVVSNPEFLKEGDAINDFMRPDRIIVGTSSAQALVVMQQLYAPFNRNHDRLMCMSRRSAELTKYAANAMLATKISFMNQMATLAEAVGGDVEEIRLGIGSDPRIGYHFIYPGCGYGGSCFPKDVRALMRTAADAGVDMQILEATETVNQQQKQLLGDKVRRRFGDDLRGRIFAVWGLAFKPNTDDMREAPSRVLLEDLLTRGAKVQAYDPAAMDEAQRIYAQLDNLSLCDSAEATVQGADALIIVTEWPEFRSPDFLLLRENLKSPVIFDGRNVYSPERLKELGFEYFSIGRQAVSSPS